MSGEDNIVLKAPGQHFTESVILGIPVANLSYDGVVNQVLSWATQRQNRYIGVCNVHSVTSANWNVMLNKALVRADMNTADGMPLVWMQRLLGYSQSSRVYGPTLMLETLKRATPMNLRMAFYGGHPDRMEPFLANLREQFPGLEIVETISPPFRSLTQEEDREYTRRLNAAKPHIIWVGIGCPKQEQWMMDHSPKIKGVMLGVGAAFDFHAGAVAQAPAYLQRAGLEWLYRLYREPRRLFKRYLTTNPVFLMRASWQLLKRWLWKREYIHPWARPNWDIPHHSRPNPS